MTEEYIRHAASVVPSGRQLRWHELEFYAFTHFGMNTMKDVEWGDGTASPESFDPKKLDAHQWAEAVKSAGMKAIILTAKHHDGFCLWPSAYTDYCVKNSPWKNGKGDVVREVSDACREAGLRFGIYLSPWDRHEKTYGRGEEYNTYFKNQLTELLTNYGDIFCVWFDGACGEGENGKKQVYDWEGYYEIIRKYQPDAVINICGPDIRWCGNEAGICRKAEWNVVPSFYAQQERIAENSQKTKDVPPDNIDYALEDIGGRDVIKKYSDLIWYPAEVDVSIRKGWFYHKEEDSTVKPLSKLLEIYYNSVGANASLLLNIPPDADGLIADADVKALKELGDHLRKEFAVNLASGAEVPCNCEPDAGHKAENILSEDDSYWYSGEEPENAEIVIDLGEEKDIDSVVLKEHIATGQQIEKFSLYSGSPEKWTKIYDGTVIGSKRIARMKDVKTRYIKFTLESTRCFAAISNISVY